MSEPQRQICLLAPHPRTPCAAVRTITVRLEAGLGQGLRLEYELAGAVGRVRLPPQAPPGRAEGLWRHTCCEAFIAAGPGAAYAELNFSPSGQWAAYGFSDYRAGMAPLALEAPRIELQSGAERLVLCAAISWPHPLAPAGQPRARLGLATVVEEDSGALSYWALAHPRERPDFHDPRGFALTLPVP